MSETIEERSTHLQRSNLTVEITRHDSRHLFFSPAYHSDATMSHLIAKRDSLPDTSTRCLVTGRLGETAPQRRPKSNGVFTMKCLFLLLAMWSLSACAGRNFDDDDTPRTAPAQVGVVNHTGNYIYSASVDGAGGGGMTRWGAGNANICCASIPRVWYPGMKVRVRWDMPDGHTHNVKEKIVEVEKYDEPGDIYLHFFPNDEIRAIVTNIGGSSQKHPIPPPIKPANAK